MSNPQAIERFTDQWMNDPEFREQMRQDPEGTVQRHGLELDEDDRQTLHSIDWNLPDEQLNERVSKRTVWC
jgi:hypothetical protein